MLADSEKIKKLNLRTVASLRKSLKAVKSRRVEEFKNSSGKSYTSWKKDEIVNFIIKKKEWFKTIHNGLEHNIDMEKMKPKVSPVKAKVKAKAQPPLKAKVSKPNAKAEIKQNKDNIKELKAELKIAKKNKNEAEIKNIIEEIKENEEENEFWKKDLKSKN